MMTSREQFNRVGHDSNPSQTMTLTACPVGRLGEGISPPPLPSGPLLLVLVLFFLFSNGCHIGGVGGGFLRLVLSASLLTLLLLLQLMPVERGGGFYHKEIVTFYL